MNIITLCECNFVSQRCPSSIRTFWLLEGPFSSLYAKVMPVLVIGFLVPKPNPNLGHTNPYSDRRNPDRIKRTHLPILQLLLKNTKTLRRRKLSSRELQGGFGGTKPENCRSDHHLKHSNSKACFLIKPLNLSLSRFISQFCCIN